MTRTLAIHIGGTTVKWARFDGEPESGRVAAQCQPTPDTVVGFRSLLDSLAQDRAAAPERVCIGFPGPIAADGRLSRACTWLPGQDLINFDLRDEVQRVWPGVHTSVINDVSAYGRFLLHEGHRDFCVLNIGSGIGAKLYAGGCELLGPGCRGGEIGHFVDPCVPAALCCDCGGRQHIGAISSGRGVARFARWRAQGARAAYDRSDIARAVGDPLALTEADIVAHTHDPYVRTLLAEAMAPLARAAALIHLSSGCETFVLVGGFAQALGELLPVLLAECSAASSWNDGCDWQRAYTVLHDERTASLLGLYWQGVLHAKA